VILGPFFMNYCNKCQNFVPNSFSAVDMLSFDVHHVVDPKIPNLNLKKCKKVDFGNSVSRAYFY